MNLKYCCQQWRALAPDIRDAKWSELSDVKPAYLVSPILDMLCFIDNYCPVCGESLKEEVKTVSRKPVPSQEAPPSQDLIDCPSCKGVGNLGEGEGGRKQFCNTCCGEKKIRQPKQVNADKLAKLDDLRSKLKSKQKE